MQPDPAAAGHHPDPGLQRQRPRRRHLRGRRRAGARRLHRAPHRRLRRRSAPTTTATPCAPSTSTRTRTAPGRSLFDADNQPGRRHARSTGKCTSDADGDHRDPEPRPQPLRRHRHARRRRPDRPLGPDHDPRGRPRLRHLDARRATTGFDTELVKGGEPVPASQFGFVRTRPLHVPRTNAPTGEVKGVAVAGLPYIGGQNGQVVPETGFAGAKVDGPIKQPVGRAVRPRRRVTRRSTSAAAPPTAPSTSRTCPTAPTS